MAQAGLCKGADSLQPCCSYKQSMIVGEGSDQKLDIHGSAGDIRGICTIVIIRYAGQIAYGNLSSVVFITRLHCVCVWGGGGI